MGDDWQQMIGRPHLHHLPSGFFFVRLPVDLKRVSFCAPLKSLTEDELKDISRLYMLFDLHKRNNQVKAVTEEYRTAKYLQLWFIMQGSDCDTVNGAC